MKIEMHPHAVDFRHIMWDELKNWRLVHFCEGRYEWNGTAKIDGHAVFYWKGWQD